MMNTTDILAIVPAFEIRRDPLRLRNLRAVLAKLREAGVDVVVSEQLSGKYALRAGDLPAGVELYTFELSGGFRKGVAANRAFVERCDRPYVWIHDGDVLLGFSEALSLADGTEDAIQPFGRLYRLSDAQTEEKLSAGRVNVVPGRTDAVRDFGGGSLIVRSDVFRAVRGFDERFECWGSEDLELGERISSLYAVRTLSRIHGAHLWHKPTAKRLRKLAQAGNRHLLRVARWLRGYEPTLVVGAVESSIPGSAETALPEVLEDFSIVSCAYGLNDVREAAVRTAVASWAEQRPRPGEIVFVELAFDEDPFRLEEFVRDLPGGKFVGVRGTDANRAIFEKESLFNIGAGRLRDEARIVGFVDADLRSADPLWLGTLRNKVAGGPASAVVQGFRKLRDTKIPEREFSRFSYAWQYLRQHKRNIGQAPGGVWAMRREFFETLGGWNPYFVPGSGDSAFVVEHFPGREYSTWPLRWEYWRRALRTGQPIGSLDVVPIDVEHVFHGPLTDRAYKWSREVVAWLVRDVRDVVEIDESGLVAWKDPREPLRYVLERKPRLVSREATEAVVAEALLFAGRELSGNAFVATTVVPEKPTPDALKRFRAITLPTVREAALGLDADVWPFFWLVLVPGRQDLADQLEDTLRAVSDAPELRVVKIERGESVAAVAAREVGLLAVGAERIATAGVPFGSGIVDSHFEKIVERLPDGGSAIVDSSIGAVATLGESRLRAGRQGLDVVAEFRCYVERRISGGVRTVLGDLRDLDPATLQITQAAGVRWLYIPADADEDPGIAFGRTDLPPGFSIDWEALTEPMQ